MTIPDAPPVVSVVIITYNHEQYIHQAIASVLEQEFEEPFEVLVADDCSTDETLEEVRRFQGDSRIRILQAAQNLGVQPNLRRALEAAAGEFVALLEGDDYWRDTSKLARQVAQLRAIPRASSSAHSTPCTDGDRPNGWNWGDDSFMQEDESLSLESLAKVTNPHMSSLVYRRKLLPSTPLWFDGLRASDWLIFFLLAEGGPIAIIQREMSVHRFNDGSTWNPLTLVEQRCDLLIGALRLAKHEGRAADIVRSERIPYLYRVFFSSTLRPPISRQKMAGLWRVVATAPGSSFKEFIRWMCARVRDRVATGETRHAADRLENNTPGHG